MGSIDWDSALADTYIPLARQFKAAGRPMRSRPAINRQEQLQAAEVRRRVDRTSWGYRGGVGLGEQRRIEAGRRRGLVDCAKCGALRPPAELLLWRQLYAPAGGRMDFYACRGGCREVGGGWRPRRTRGRASE